MNNGGPCTFGGARSRTSPGSQSSRDDAMLALAEATTATAASSTCCEETSWVATNWLALESFTVQQGCVRS